MECFTHLRNIQDLLSDGKTPYERRFGIPQFGPKVLPGIFLGYAFNAGGIWKGDILVADIEEMEEMDASELHAKKTQCKGSVNAHEW